MACDFLTLECFLAVCDTKNVSRAADRVGRTQSAISQQIAKLEQHVGHKLFKRDPKFTLTSEGEILYSYAKKIIHLNHEMMDRLVQPELAGEVRFGLPEDFASVFLSDVLSEYAFLHPGTKLFVECDLTLNLYERFTNQEFDLVLVKMNRPEDFPNGINVWSEPLEWVGNHTFFMDKNSEKIPLVCAPQPCVYRSRAIKSLESVSRQWRIVFSSHSYASTIAAVKAGMGVTVLPRNMIPKELSIIRQGENMPTLDDTHISLLKHHNHNLALNAFEKFVMERLCVMS